MTMRGISWLAAGAGVAALMLVSRCTGGSAAADKAKIAALTAQIAADSVRLEERRAQLVRDSVARVAAEQLAAAARREAAKQKARSDALDAQVRILSDSFAVLADRDTVALPPLVIRTLVEMRGTIASQAKALHADSLEKNRLHAELASARATIAAGDTLSGRRAEKIDVLEETRPRWWQRLGGAVVTAGSASGGAAVGAVVGGPAGAAVGGAVGAIAGWIAAR